MGPGSVSKFGSQKSMSPLLEFNKEEALTGPHGFSVNLDASCQDLIPIAQLLPNFSVSKTYYFRLIPDIPYLGYILDPVGAIINYID